MDDDDPTVSDLLSDQAERERRERELAEDAEHSTEQHKAIRRADRAAYLRSKLEQQAEHPDEPSQ